MINAQGIYTHPLLVLQQNRMTDDATLEKNIEALASIASARQETVAQVLLSNYLSNPPALYEAITVELAKEFREGMLLQARIQDGASLEEVIEAQRGKLS